MPVQFAYDGQIRRFVTQFIRMLSNFQVEFGQNTDGSRTLQTVPIYYGDVSRQAAMILRGNSENTLNAVPAMACYISALAYDRDRVLNPYHEGSIRVREQVYNPDIQNYTGTQDGLYTVERLMPTPFKLTLKCSSAAFSFSKIQLASFVASQGVEWSNTVIGFVNGKQNAPR